MRLLLADKNYSGGVVKGQVLWVGLAVTSGNGAAAQAACRLEGVVTSTTFVSVVMPYLNIYKRTAKLGMTLTIPEAGLCNGWVGNAYDYIVCLRAGPFPLSVHPRFSISH